MSHPQSPDTLYTKSAVDVRSTLAGHVSGDHPLSPLAVAAGMPAIMRPLFGDPSGELWETETKQLSLGLRRYRRQLRKFALEELAPLALELDATEHWPVGELPEAMDKLLAKAADAGFMSDMLPKPLGSGSPLNMAQPLIMTASLKTEEFARVCGGLMLFLSAHMLGQVPMILSGQLGTTSKYLKALRKNMKGEPYVFAYAITEPGAGSDVEDGHGASMAKPGLVARRVSGGWILNGTKVFISGGDVASGYTVFAALEGEGYESWTCFFVERGTPGFKPVRTELKMGMRASGAAELEFVNVFVPDEDVVGKVRGGWALNRQTLNLSRIPVAAMAVGFAQAACDITTDWARATRVGGRPVLDEQSVQLTLADVYAKTSGIRAQLWRTAGTWRVRQAYGAMNKFHATDTAMEVIEQCMDLIGVESLLHTTRLEKVWRDTRLTQIFEGTNQINRLAVIEDLQDHLVRPTTQGSIR